jgi:hypothetical protein
VIEARDGDVVKLTEEVCPYLPGLARETFVPNKDNKSKVEFI